MVPICISLGYVIPNLIYLVFPESLIDFFSKENGFHLQT